MTDDGQGGAGKCAACFSESVAFLKFSRDIAHISAKGFEAKENLPQGMSERVRARCGPGGWGRGAGGRRVLNAGHPVAGFYFTNELIKACSVRGCAGIGCWALVF